MDLLGSLHDGEKESFLQIFLHKPVSVPFHRMKSPVIQLKCMRDICRSGKKG